MAFGESFSVERATNGASIALVCHAHLAGLQLLSGKAADLIGTSRVAHTKEVSNAVVEGQLTRPGARSLRSPEAEDSPVTNIIGVAIRTRNTGYGEKIE